MNEKFLELVFILASDWNNFLDCVLDIEVMPVI